MAIYFVQTTFESASGLPQDACVNTWHCIAPDDAGAVQFSANVRDFYQDAHGGTGDPLVTYYSQTLSGNAVNRLYDLGDPEPRQPVDTLAWTFGPNNTLGGLPEEVALCLSFKYPPASGVNPQSTRNRVFLGPLNVLALAGAGIADTNWTTPPRPDATFTQIAVNAALFLRDTAPGHATTSVWAVYSPTLDVAVNVDSGWVDNAFDTQRRRGVDPTSRSTF